MALIHTEVLGEGKFAVSRDGVAIIERDGMRCIDLGSTEIIAWPLPEELRKWHPIPAETKSLRAGFFKAHRNGFTYVTSWSGNPNGIFCGVLIAEVDADAQIEQRHKNNRRTALKRAFPDGVHPIILEQGNLDEKTIRVAILLENDNTIRITDSRGSREYHWVGGPNRADRKMHCRPAPKPRRSRKACVPALAIA